MNGDRWYERACGIGLESHAERVAHELERAYNLGRVESEEADAFVAASYSRKTFRWVVALVAITATNFLMHFAWTMLPL